MQSLTRIAAFEFAGGDAFFAGLALLMTGAILATLRDGPRVRMGFRLATICSVIVVAVSGTPLPMWFYAIGLLLSLLSLWPRPTAAEGSRPPRGFRIVATLLCCWCGAAIAWEFFYRLSPRLNTSTGYDTLAIIGDSPSNL